MGIRSFLRRWLGIESVEKTVKTTVGRAYQQPVATARMPYERVERPVRLKRISKPRTVQGYYEKIGGVKAVSNIERYYGRPENWLRIHSDNAHYRVKCITTPEPKQRDITIKFTSKLEAINFRNQVIAHHERMKAKAAKSGLNYN